MDGEPDIRRNIEKRSYRFAVAVTVFCQYHDVDYGAAGQICRQLMRSATSVGANVREAQGGQSRADFLSKMSIAWKEAKESEYWLRLALDSGMFPRAVVIPIGTAIATSWGTEFTWGSFLAGNEAKHEGKLVVGRGKGQRATVLFLIGKVDSNLGISEARQVQLSQVRNSWFSDFGNHSPDGMDVGLLTDAYLLWAESSQLVRIIGAIVGKTRRSMDSNRRSRRGSTPHSKLQTPNS